MFRRGALGRDYADGEEIVRQGEVGDCMYVVQAGRVEVLQDGDEGEQRLAVLETGDCFGEMAVFERELRSATVRSLGPSRVLRIDKKTLLRRIKEDPLLAVNLLQTMSHRIRELNASLAHPRAAAAKRGASPAQEADGGDPDPAPVRTHVAAAPRPAPIPPDRLTPAYRPAQVEKPAPCQVGCPNCGDIRAWIGTVAQRAKLGLSEAEAFERAWRIVTEVNPFPAVMGRVCPHPCESHCNRSDHDEPLAINAMERFLGDWAIGAGLALAPLEAASRAESIGVVGAGPSGLSFAYQMARRGYPVTVYESRERPGGMLRWGIPGYRLPPAILDAEVERLLALGVTLRTGVALGRDVTLDELHRRHAAVYLGIGAQVGLGLGIPGESGAGVLSGTAFLERFNRDEPVDLGRRVVVIGGGNTAIDAARAARRLGAGVTILYRRSREEMPATAHEVGAALEEGVELVLLAAPLRIERGADGTPRELVAQRMKLGEPGDDGRRRPVPLPGSEFRLAFDTMIAAVSQQPDLVGLDTVAVEGRWLRTGENGRIEPGLWAGGDALGLGIAGVAIAQGRRAAESLHAELRGQRHPAPAPTDRRPPGPERIVVQLYDRRPAVRGEPLDPAGRLDRPRDEVVGGLTREQFLAEIERCFSCGSCFGCEQCAMYCTAGCFTRLEQVRPGVYFTLDTDLCQECGKCVEVCPCGYLEARPADAPSISRPPDGCSG